MITFFKMDIDESMCVCVLVKRVVVNLCTSGVKTRFCVAHLGEISCNYLCFFPSFLISVGVLQQTAHVMYSERETFHEQISGGVRKNVTI